MSKEEEETIYSDDHHIDLVSRSGEECAVVAQDSTSSEDLYDSIVTFGHQSSEKNILKRCTMKIYSNQRATLKNHFSVWFL